jgi:hypothetical protein
MVYYRTPPRLLSLLAGVDGLRWGGTHARDPSEREEMAEWGFRAQIIWPGLGDGILVLR